MTEDASHRAPSAVGTKPKERNFGPARQVCLDVNPLMATKMTEAARKASMPMPRYAAMLLEAAWAARSGKSMGDGHMDAWVGACIALYGSQRSPQEIAEVLGVSVKVVNRMVDAWRKVLADDDR
jgi:hypothetical protein